MVAEACSTPAAPVVITCPVVEPILPSLVTLPCVWADVANALACWPSTVSAFKFVTAVVDVTLSGAVPVATVEVKVLPETLPVAPTEDGVIACPLMLDTGRFTTALAEFLANNRPSAVLIASSPGESCPAVGVAAAVLLFLRRIVLGMIKPV